MVVDILIPSAILGLGIFLWGVSMGLLMVGEDRVGPLVLAAVGTGAIGVGIVWGMAVMGSPLFPW